MNDYEQKMVNELKDILSDISPDEYTDFDYLRWLQGYDFKLDAIVPHLRHHFLCLSSYDFKNLGKSEIMEKYWVWGLIKLTGHGHSFPYIETQGTWDGEGVMKSVSKVDIMLHIMHKAELVLKVMRNHESESGYQSGLMFIIDLDGMQISANKLSIVNGCYKDLVNFMLEHYVEMMHKLIIINAPTIIWALYNIVKSVLPEKTKQKFIVLGSSWKTDILQYCNPEILPVHYGGTMVDENNDPKCASQIVYCTKVPEKLYWSPSSNDPVPEDLTVLTVRAGTVGFVTVEITKENSSLEWYFCTDNSWGFGIFFTENESESKLENMEMVFPHLKYFRGPSVVPENGKLVCKKCGYYKLWFNNSFSWFAKLNVSYKIAVSS